MKSKSLYVCESCGAESPKWAGKCSVCGAWNSMVESTVIHKQARAGKQIILTNQEVEGLQKRIAGDTIPTLTGLGELDLVLGEGIVDAQVLLFSGEPGIGKSTLLLQILKNLHSQGKSVLYASGEESLGQVANRAERLFGKGYPDLPFLGGVGLRVLLNKIAEEKPEFVVVDSIQTLYDEDLPGMPGSLTQIKSCASELVSAAKNSGFTLIIVGHITKEGTIAGPKVLEHLVDTVLQMEGGEGDFRLLRVLKNRFGPTGEVGLMIMTEMGLVDMSPEHSLFSGGSEGGIGAAKTLAVEGNRSIVVEVQALVNDTVFAYPKRVAEGVSNSRLQLICAILDRFLNAGLGSKDVYVRTAGGYKLQSPASDLAVAAAIMSSVNSKLIPGDQLYLGEVGLSGRLTLQANVHSKLKNIKKQGIAKVICPFVAKMTSDSKLLQIKSLPELMKV